MSEHTPAPWVVSPLSDLMVSADRGDHQIPLAFIYGPSFAERSEVGRRALADARLIAAAPELLDVLDRISGELKGALSLLEPVCRREFGNSNYNILVGLVQEAKAVITKATPSPLQTA